MGQGEHELPEPMLPGLTMMPPGPGPGPGPGIGITFGSAGVGGGNGVGVGNGPGGGGCCPQAKLLKPTLIAMAPKNLAKVTFMEIPFSQLREVL